MDTKERIIFIYY